MKFYEVNHDHTAQPGGSYVCHCMTLAEAHAEAKTVDEPVYRPNVRITEVDVASDKAAICLLLNEALGTRAAASTLRANPAPVVTARGRQWSLTARGGLKPMFDTPASGQVEGD